MRCLLLLAIALATLVLARARPHPHPHPHENGDSNHAMQRALQRQKQQEINQAKASAKGHYFHRNKVVHALPKKPLSPEELKAQQEATEKKREAEERVATEQARRDKEVAEEAARDEKAQEKQKQISRDLHELNVVATSTTTTAAVEETAEVVTTTTTHTTTRAPTPAELAEGEEVKREKAEKEQRDSEAQAKSKQRTAKQNAQDREAREAKVKEEEHSLQEQAEKSNPVKRMKSLDGQVQADEAAAKNILGRGDLKAPELHITAPVADPAVLAMEGREQAKDMVPKIVQRTQAQAHALAHQKRAKTKSTGKSAKQVAEDLENDRLSAALDLKKVHMDAAALKVKADEGNAAAEAKRLKDLRVSEVVEPAAPEPLAASPRPLFRPSHPKKFDPNSPERVAKRAVAADEQREEQLQNKQEDMMASMEAVKRQLHGSK